VNELLLVHRYQTGSYLRRDFERQLYLKLARAFDEFSSVSPSTNSIA
jgi:hypothetical protein